MKEHIAEPLQSGKQIVYGDEKYIYLSKLYKYIPSYYLFSLKVLCHVSIGILSMRQPASASKFNVIGMIDDWGLLTLCTTPPLFGHLLEHQSILTLHPSELGIAWRISCPKQRQRNTIGFDVNLLSDQDHTESNLPSDQISKTRYGGRGRHTRLWLVAELLHTS